MPFPVQHILGTLFLVVPAGPIKVETVYGSAILVVEKENLHPGLQGRDETNLVLDSRTDHLPVEN